jgi:CO/xanthine dehydrogenase Mo-binding subunit
VLHGDDEVEFVDLYHGAAEVGQGSHTALIQMAAEATGVDPSQIRAEFSDTDSGGDSGSVSASRMTWMAGNSILGAVEEAGKRWLEGDRPAMGEFRFVPPPTEALDPETGAGQPNFTYAYVAEIADVAVDIDSGHIVIERIICADDVGKAINPDLVVGQIHGGVVQGVGYTLSERLVVENGRIVNPRLSTYLIPGIGDIPRHVDAVLVEHPDPLGPWGVRGMAELPLIPVAPAVIAAIHNATGVWFHSFPLTPPHVVAGLRRAGIGGVGAP